MSFRLYALAGAAAVIGGMGLVLAVTRADLTDAKRELGDHRACAAAVKGVAPKGGKLADADRVCTPEIAAADRKARQLDACELALQGNTTELQDDQVVASNGAAVTQRCPPHVVSLFGQTLADGATILGLRGVIDDAEADRNQAVVRAERRGRQLAERDRRAQAVRESAPRDSDGLRVYDADRLRERWEVAP